MKKHEKKWVAFVTVYNTLFGYYSFCPVFLNFQPDPTVKYSIVQTPNGEVTLVPEVQTPVTTKGLNIERFNPPPTEELKIERYRPKCASTC